MQGMLANNAMIDNDGTCELEFIARHAFLQADELLKAENE
jgi:hypothetical protein